MASDPSSGGSRVTAAMQPVSGGSSGSVSDLIANYISTGVSSAKINVIIPAYGQAYYVPNAPSNGWASLGLAASQSNACTGPYQATYGAFVGGNGMCGQVCVCHFERESPSKFPSLFNRLSLYSMGYDYVLLL